MFGVLGVVFYAIVNVVPHKCYLYLGFAVGSYLVIYLFGRCLAMHNLHVVFEHTSLELTSKQTTINYMILVVIDVMFLS